MKLSSLIKKAKFTRVNEHINDINFLESNIRGEVKIYHFDRYITLEDTIKEMEKDGYEPANILELIQWSIENPKNEDWVVALGSVWQASGGRRLVPYLDGDADRRNLSLHWFDDEWDSLYRFASVKKGFETNKKVVEPEEIKKRIFSRITDWKDCWIWGASKRKGYGLIRIDGTKKSVHRVLYEILVAPIPNGYTIDHLCRNHSCVNPSHLQPVTSRENTLRGIGPSAINAKKTHCKRGHKLQDSNLYIGKKGQRICKTCNKNR